MKYFLLLMAVLGGLRCAGQDSTAIQRGAIQRDTATNVVADSLSADALLADLVDSSATQPLLPKRMIFGQRIFWGPKGLLRVTNLAPLTVEGREKELKIRRTMLVSHQVLGFVTLAGMVAQGIVGAQLYRAGPDNYLRLLGAHQALGTGVNIAYGTTALLSLTAPPKLVEHRRGLTSIKLHKYLAFVHLTGMVATNILGKQVSNNYELKPYHRAAAYTTFAAFAASVIAIKF